MRNWITLVVSVIMWAGHATAEDSRLRSLETSDAGRQWEAVGRLDIDGKGFCTGALISPELVLTAAHCLFQSETGERINHENIEFRAGWRNGRASASRAVRRAVIHPDFDYGAKTSYARVRNDIALLELRWPIRNGIIEPFSIGQSPRKGDEVGVVSYARDRAEAPSLQDVCKVLARQQGVLVTSCSVDFGSSGAPIFRVEGDEVNIVSVISAKAEADGRKVALGTSLVKQVEDLKAELAAGKGYSHLAPLSGMRILASGQRNQTGAKFVRP